MTNLKSLCAQELIHATELVVKNERLSTAEVIRHFQEISDRKLYLKRGYPSLFEMVTKHFGYCAASAQRRISSMRLVREMPELTSKIESGELSLTAASQLQTFFRTEKSKPYSKTKKLEVVTECLNKSSREVEKKLASLSPKSDKRDDIRFTDNDRLRMSVTISEELFHKLENLKHQYNLSSNEDVIDMLANAFTKRRDDAALLPAPEVKARHIPAVTKKIVIRENKGQGCAYVDPKTKILCGMKQDLQLDHIHPHSLGGSNTVDNLRVLCANHNRYVWHYEQKNNGRENST